MAEKLPAWTAQKVAILVIVIVFFVSSFALTGLVVWEQFFNKDNAAVNLEEDIDVTEGDTLEGTQLANFTPVESVDKLEIIDQEVGTGDEAKASSNVTAHYTGAVAATGVIFQSSLDGGQPIPFPLDGVIEGWKEGIPGMKVGGKRRLIIPADMAYGANPPAGSGIPANAALVFDVELVAVE